MVHQLNVGAIQMTEWEAPGPGPWQQDSAHMPISTTLSMRKIYPEGFNRGFTETFGRYGMLLDRLAMGEANGFIYHQPQPFDMPGPNGPMSPEEAGAEIGRRTAIAEEVYQPEKNLPLGIIISLTLVTIVYGAVVLIMSASIPFDSFAL